MLSTLVIALLSAPISELPVLRKDQPLCAIMVMLPFSKNDELSLLVDERPTPVPVATSCTVVLYELLSIHWVFSLGLSRGLINS